MIHMRATWALATLVALSGTAIRGAEIEKRPTTHSQRETWAVRVVRQTKDSIVTLKVAKKSSRKDTVGTGFIVDERGYVVTNRHVVANRVEGGIKVVLSDGTSFIGQLDFEDESHDLAVVHIQTERKLKALPLGPATDVMVGEDVIAIGHPFGYVNSVSKGIVSALEREVEMPGGVILKGLLQTTASINPGNSGGPLLNADGEVIGINVALRSDAQNIAFALSADTVQQVLSRRLSASTKMKIGIYHGLDVRESVETEGETRSRVLVHEVAAGTPAAEAGMKEGDQIVKLGALRVANRFDVERALWDVHNGDTVRATVLRSGREVQVPLKFDRDSVKTASR
jgi:serine protease Do